MTSPGTACRFARNEAGTLCLALTQVTDHLQSVSEGCQHGTSCTKGSRAGVPKSWVQLSVGFLPQGCLE